MKTKPRSPSIVVLAGPNGAGKSTTAPALLKGTLRVTEFVNADVLAQGLSAFAPERVSLTAGKIMLARLKQLAKEREDFAFETTLASRTFAPWLAGLKKDGYAFNLVFLWLPSAEMAMARVAERVRMGGHSVAEETIRRRYASGLRNFFSLYQPLATRWRIYDNSHAGRQVLIATGKGSAMVRSLDRQVWDQIRKAAGQ